MEAERKSPKIDTTDSEFDNYNPMLEDYCNEKFNKYELGPGGDLDDELQPGAAALRKNESNLPCRIALKKLPLGMGQMGIKNLCSQYGTVIDVHVPRDYPSTNPFVYVEFKSVSEADRAIREIMEIKDLGIRAKFATRKTRQEIPQFQNNIDEFETFESIREWENPSQSHARYASQIKSPVKPILPEQKPRVTDQDYENSKLKENDPTENYLVEKKAYRYKYNPDPNSMAMLKQMSEKSSGNYDAQTGVYVARGMEEYRKKVIIRKCLFCEDPAQNMCQTCFAPYCSRTCQTNDWYRHKKDCAPVPNLIKDNLNDVQYKPYNKGDVSRPVILNNFVNVPADDDTEGSSSSSPIKLTNEELLENSSSVSGNEKLVMPRNFESNNILDNSRAPRKKFIVPVIDMPKVNSKVIITAISDVNSVFIRPIDRAYNEEYLKLRNEIQAAAKFAQPMPRVVETGDVVLAPYENEMCRAIVTSVEKDMAYIAYIDYGNTGEIPLKDIRKLDIRVRSLKRHVFKVYLQGVQSGVKNTDVAEYMNQLLASEAELMIASISKVKNSNYVELLEIKTKRSVNDTINDLNEIKQPNVTDEVFYITDLDEKPLKMGLNVKLYTTHISIVADTVIICCIDEDNMSDYVEINKLVEKYCQSVPDGNYCPRDSEMCLVKHDDVWYRATGIESVGDGFPLVNLIDIGTVVKEDIKNIRKMPRQLGISIITQYCQVKNFKSVNEKQTMEILRDHNVEPNNFIFANVEESDNKEGHMYQIEIIGLESNGN